MSLPEVSAPQPQFPPPAAAAKPKKAWFKKWWVWVLVIVGIAIIASAASPKGAQTAAPSAEPATASATPSAPATWDVDAAFAKLVVDMPRADAEAALGKQGECAESESSLGKSAICNYGSILKDKAVITVTYRDDKVTYFVKNKY